MTAHVPCATLAAAEQQTCTPSLSSQTGRLLHPKKKTPTTTASTVLGQQQGTRRRHALYSSSTLATLSSSRPFQRPMTAQVDISSWCRRKAIPCCTHLLPRPAVETCLVPCLPGSYQLIGPIICCTAAAQVKTVGGSAEYSLADCLSPAASKGTASPHSSPPVSKGSAEDAEVHPSKAYIPDPQVPPGSVLNS